MRSIWCLRWLVMCLVTNVEKHFVSPLAWSHVEVNFVSFLAYILFVQQMLRCILCPRWHMRCLVNKCWEAFCLLVGKLWVWWTHIKLHFVSSPSLDGLGNHMLICTSYPRWRRRGLDNKCWDAFLCITGLEEGFSQHMLIYVLCPRWYLMCLVNTCWVAFCIPAGIWWVWS